MAEFKRPACTLGQKQLAAVKNPQLERGIKQLEAACPRDFRARPLATVDIGPYGSGVGHDEFVGDAMQCYMQTLLYVFKRDPAFADKAIGVMRAWAGTCKVFKGANAPLECAWGGTAFVRAAELLRFVYPEGWKKSGVVEPFERFIDTILLPNLTGRYKEIAKWNNNWILTIQEALMQIGLYRGDAARFQWVVKEFKDTLPRCVEEDGFCTETKRDLCHTQFQIGSMVQIAEMAWHQGLDLYNDLIFKCMEYHASILNGNVPAGLKRDELKDVWFMGCAWCVGHNHFVNRKKRLMPETTLLLRGRKTPEKLSFNWGPGWIHCNSF